MSAFGKEIRRSITHSLGRFIALFAITALGVGFFAGLKMTGPDMRIFADDFFDETRFMDIRVLSTLGVDDEDIAAIGEIEGVEAVMPAHETDITGTLNGEQYVFRIHSMPTGALRDVPGEEYLNQLQLVSGSWPTRPGHCLISADRVLKSAVSIGDTIVVTECSGDLDSTLQVRVFTVCGFVKSADYVSATSLGTSSLGSGSVEQFMYVPEAAFAKDYPYTDIYIRVAGAADEFADSDAYWAVVDAVEERIGQVAPALASARTERVKAPYYAELDDAQADLDEGQREYEDGVAEYEDGVAEYESGKSAYAARLAEWQRGLAAYQSALAEFNEKNGYYERAVEVLDRLRERAEEHIDDEVAQALYERALEALSGIKAQLDDAQQQLDDSWGQLAWAKRQLDAAAATLDAAAEELAGAADELADALSELEQGEADLAQARADLENMAPAEYYVLDRDKNYGIVSYMSDTNRIDRIASLFPLIFFLVAALVALTTMTRMVEEERSLIGTYKALGYGTGRIVSKYIIYAGIASVLGSVVGIAVLSQVLPKVIYGAYSIVYFVPETAYPIDWPIAILAAGLGVGVVLLSTWGAVAATLRERPAALMLPRAPKAGKRIALERIPLVWDRLSFSWKVTCRNLFRYKKRLIMTVIGIAGCTMLLLTGWGLKDSINDIIDKEFIDIVHYNLSVSTDDELGEESAAKLDAVLSDDDLVAESTFVQTLTFMAVPGTGADLVVDVVVPKSRMAFADFLEMRERTSGTWLELGSSGVVVTEKMATLLGVGVGDKITLYDQDATGNRTSVSHTMRVAGIMENYIYNYVYISPELYTEIWGEAPAWNTVLIQATDDEDGRVRLAEELRAIDGVRTVSYNDELIETYRTMLSSVNMITWVLILAAAALAFIVLYNLTNINITERVREIATLKVLGFTRGEVYAYIFREVALLTILGALVGLVLGIWLEGWVVVTAEVDQVMFGRSIHALSYAISFALTGVFAALVMLVMRHKLNRVNMVESLKAVE